MGNSVPVWAVVPAAGIGSRMQSDIPKQYLAFQGKTLIEHSLDRLLSHPEIDGAVVVLRQEDTTWEKLAYLAEKPVFTTTAARSAMHSVYSGLDHAAISIAEMTQSRWCMMRCDLWLATRIWQRYRCRTATFSRCDTGGPGYRYLETAE